ncbi:MAG: 23S rRNA methyltransferase [Actinobacteria bacterium HGW-Actinobacteria-2]|nr:MAG: 23S rRNA methyltransferase [Actinobacteria bacterium HGW-Actinobacteria-2]
MNLSAAAVLLACPTCRDSLSLTEGALRCPNGHSYDIARQGYVNLLGGAEPPNADTSAMLDARARVHQAGVFEPVATVIGELCSGRLHVLEAGVGTGHYLAAALGTEPSAVGVGLDVSKAAARHCLRADRRIAAVVADVWKPLPVRDRAVDVVMSVFAPRNLPEFSRVLRPDGRFIAVTPRGGHLTGLRDAYGLLDIPIGKADQLSAAAGEFFDLIDTRVVKYRLPVSETLATDLIAMGPNAFHQVPTTVTASTINVDVTIQVFRPLP